VARITGPLVKYPARISFAWYFMAIVLGTMLLTRPESCAPDREPISVIDALFTATSAVCVTGLAVRSTGNDYSGFGQVVILALVQLGGIGIITVTTYLTFRLGRRETLRQRTVVTETIAGTELPSDLGRLLGDVILLTLLFEGIGFVLLAVRNLYDYPVGTALWHALFHSVSAFCNAGFGLLDENMIPYQGDPLVNFTIMGLIVIGGLGFPVLLDLRKSRRYPRARRWEVLHLHSKMMLLGTGALLLSGTVMFMALEWDNVLRDMPLSYRLMASMFQSVVPRTAGFNTVPIGELTDATLFIMILLMLVGGGPCSTAGGLKVSTLMVLVARAWSTFRGFTRVNVFRRTIPNETVARASTTALVFAFVVIAGATSLLVFEQSRLVDIAYRGVFIDSLFEFVSALCTVGLSTGITPSLSAAGKVVLIVAMFLGRLGPITVFIVFSRAERESRIAFPDERPLIG